MSQTVKTLIRLREMILNRELEPGERLLEVALVERLDVSRTPVRAALVKLSEQGLVERLPGGGYMVREFTERDIRDSIEIRGLIEGLAARLAAEQGVSGFALGKLKSTVSAIDALLDNTELSSEDIATYLELNDLFHRQLITLAESFIVEHMLEHIVTLPFAAPNAFVITNNEITKSWQIFFVAQEQHRGIVEAIENREGLRAEMLAREHAQLSLQTLRKVIKSSSALNTVPGFKLISNAAGE